MSGATGAVDKQRVGTVAEAGRPQTVSARLSNNASEDGRHEVTRVRPFGRLPRGTEAKGALPQAARPTPFVKGFGVPIPNDPPTGPGTTKLPENSTKQFFGVGTQS